MAFNIDASSANADWTKRTWDVWTPEGRPASTLAELKAALSPSTTDQELVSFLDLPVARAMPESLREDLEALRRQMERSSDSPDVIWDGTTLPETLSDEWRALRFQLADGAKRYAWDDVFAILDRNPEMVNCTRPGGKSQYTVLHQAAHGGAPMGVGDHLLHLGAWRTARNAANETPFDVARRRGHTQLLSALEPVLRRDIPELNAIQRHFHALILERAEKLVREHALRLPELEPLLELEMPKMWFSVPGMYGGFSYWVDEISDHAVLVADSWCRVVDGSGQCHVVSPRGYLLIAEGFV